MLYLIFAKIHHKMMSSAIAKHLSNKILSKDIAWSALCEFARPLRLVLHGIVLAIVALALVSCVLLAQVVVRKIISFEAPRTGIVQIKRSTEGKVYFQPRSRIEFTSWREAQAQNRLYLSQARKGLIH